jgi:hypothetical protein
MSFMIFTASVRNILDTRSYLDRNLFKYHVVNHKSHMVWPGIEPVFICGERSVIDTSLAVWQLFFSKEGFALHVFSIKLMTGHLR